MTRIKLLPKAWMLCLLYAAMLGFCVPNGGLCQDEVAEEAEEAINQVNMIQLSPQQTASWVFGNQSNSSVSPRTMLKGGLTLELSLIETVAPLSEPQRKKLEFAALGDVDRFMDRYDAFAKKCPSGLVPQDKYFELNREAQPLGRRYRSGLFKEGSLFRKVLRSTLDEAQFAGYSALEAELDRKRYQAIVKATVAMIDQKVPLTSDQRERLIDVTMSETEPLHGTIESHYKYYAVLFQMSQIREDKIKPIFTDEEWPAAQRLLQQGQIAQNVIQRVAAEEFDE